MNTHCDPIEMDLTQVDGNAFAIMGAWSKEARRQGRTPEEIKSVMDDARSSDYNHLLAVIASHTKAPEEPCDSW
jgi:hypothetical protein